MTNITPPGDIIRKAITWIAAMQESHPAKNRAEIIKLAEIQFNLSPKDCEFLDRNFTNPPN